MILFLCVFYQRAVYQNKLGFLLRPQGSLGELDVGFRFLAGDIAVVVIRVGCREL